MTTPEPTVDDIRDCHVSMTALMVRWLWTSTELRNDLTHRVNIWRRTVWNSGSIHDGNYALSDDRWEILVGDLCDLRRECLTADEWEAGAMEWLTPLVADRAAHTLAALRARVDLESWQCGSIRYVLASDTDVILHVLNAAWPASPFADGSMRRDLLQMCRECEAQGRKTLRTMTYRTKTWLNNYPAWVALMPPTDWHRDGADPNVRGAWDFWGQFVTHRFTFHAARGQTLRDTGQFPFSTCNAGAPLAALRQHLEGLPNGR